MFSYHGTNGQNQARRYVYEFIRWKQQLDVRQIVFGGVPQNTAPGLKSANYDYLIAIKVYN